MFPVYGIVSYSVIVLDLFVVIFNNSEAKTWQSSKELSDRVV